MAWQDKPIQAIGGGLLSYWDELKEMLGKGAGNTGINVGGGVMDAATGVKSAFEQKMDTLGNRALGSEQETDFIQKMNWLQENPNASNYELQLLGITPEVKSAWEQKMRWLQNNPDATQEQLGVLGIGARSLGTPAERDFLANIMSGGGTTPYSEDTYSEKVRFLLDRAMDMGIKPGSQEFHQFMSSSFANIDKLGIGERGLDTATERQFLSDTVGQGQLLDNWYDKAQAQASDTQQQMFENKLNQLDSAQLDQVMRVMSPMSPHQKERFVYDVIQGQVSLTGYGIQDEGQPWGELTPNFAPQQMQYRTGGDLQNLGFAGY